MARPAKFTSDEILDAALIAVRENGPAATIAQVSRVVGAPSGSIYHRFGSREELFVSLWLRAVDRFQVGVLEAADLPDAQDALVAGAVHVTRYCRENPAEAVALTLYRHQALVVSGPPAFAERVRTLNVAVDAATKRLTTRRYDRSNARRRALVLTGCRQLPYGLVRPYLGGEVPYWLDDVARAASAAVLALGDAG